MRSPEKPIISKPLHQVAAELNELLNGKTLYSDGRVVDKPWLTTLFHRAQMTMKFSAVRWR